MILDYKGITIHQARHCVLSDVDLQVDEGEMVYLMGPVGSGKSTLLKTIYGELPLEGEKADVLGFDMLRFKTRHQPQLRRQMGIVFQDFQLMNTRNVRRNLDFVLSATGWKHQADRDRRIREVLEMVRMEHKIDAYTYELSGGEQQRICIARAFLNDPKVILADEPTGSLDAENGELILALLDEIRRQQHTAIIMSTHNPLWPEYFPGTVYRCEGGRLTRV